MSFILQFLDEQTATFASEVTRIGELLRFAGKMLLHIEEDHVIVSLGEFANDDIVCLDGCFHVLRLAPCLWAFTLFTSSGWFGLRQCCFGRGSLTSRLRRSQMFLPCGVITIPRCGTRV